MHLVQRFCMHSLIVVVAATIIVIDYSLTLPYDTIVPKTRSSFVDDAAVAVAPIDASPDGALRLDMLFPRSVEPAPISEMFLVHYLADGETLGALAERYDASLAAIVWANGLQNGDVLMAGQLLRIPQLEGIPYQVQKEDTLASIASDFGINVEAIIFFEPNRVDYDTVLDPGQELFLPGVSPALPNSLLSLYGGVEGWAARSPELAGVIREGQTNMREGPGQVYAKVAQFDAGRRAHLLARHEHWLKVDIAGTSGWIRADLLTASQDMISQLPETNDFPPPPPVWVWPTYGRITSGFGPRWGSFHNGIDIANRAWTPIVAARSGRVYESGWCSGYGYCVKIAHSGSVETIYGHLIDDPVVSRGEMVEAGRVIGYMGSTYDSSGGGYSTGVHLHFTILVNGLAVNPINILP